jgi:hypothetical protein
VRREREHGLCIELIALDASNQSARVCISVGAGHL